MSEINTNAHPDSIITEIKAQNYIQNTGGDLTQDSQADLASVKGDFYNTGKDTYKLTVKGKTSLDFSHRSRTFNGTVEENAEGNKMETSYTSLSRTFLGMRNSFKVGPSFFTTVVSDARLNIGASVDAKGIGMGLSVIRASMSLGVTANVCGVLCSFGMQEISNVDVLNENYLIKEEEIKLKRDFTYRDDGTPFLGKDDPRWIAEMMATCPGAVAHLFPPLPPSPPREGQINITPPQQYIKATTTEIKKKPSWEGTYDIHESQHTVPEAAVFIALMGAAKPL